MARQDGLPCGPLLLYTPHPMVRAYASYFGFSYRFWGFALER
jgi:hypothetical protein